MNTNALKKFAQNARKKLMDQVESRLDYVLNTDSAELRERQSQIDALKKELKKTGREELIEKVAYTWFNRLVALRFMDVNGYQPFRIRVLSPPEGYTQPELLTEAKQGHIPDELKIDRQRIDDLLNGSLSSQNPQNEVFRLLLVAACNHLNSIFPFLFEPIADYTELLLPEDLTSEFSIVQDVRDGMPAEACEEVEVTGWLYQFYISEKKDEVFASKGKVKKEEIPAATQLFTPRWIVEYMVQNTIGKLWLQNNPDSSLKEDMDYYIESPSAEAEDYLEIDSPEEITFLDPASGSGHILVYGFELLTKIYEEAGYPQSDIAELILTKNLHGIEIDERAAQLSGLSLMMKARDYYRRTFRKDLTPNVTCLSDLSLSEKEIKEVFDKEDIDLTDELLHDLTNMQKATNYGSLIIPHNDQSTLEKVYQKLSETTSGDDLFETEHKKALKESVTQLITLAKKYHCVAANPPYMGSNNMNKALNEFTKTHYPDSKIDLMACFMESGLGMAYKNGFLGMINQHGWMFIPGGSSKTYDSLRKKLLNIIQFDSLLHLGPRTFPEIGGEVVQSTSFTFINKKPNPNIDSSFLRLVDYKSSKAKQQRTENILNDVNGSSDYYIRSQFDFKTIPGGKICYWISDKYLAGFKNKPNLGDYLYSDGKNVTGKVDRYLKNHWEVSRNKIDYDKRWRSMTKGGESRKWYGNIEHVMDWSDEAIDNYHNTTVGRFIPEYLRDKSGITWSKISSGIPTFRFLPSESTFGEVFITSDDEENLNFFLGYLNSRLCEKYLEFINPTLSIQINDILEIPAFEKESLKNEISKLVEDCIQISKQEWDQKEISIDFKRNGLVQHQNLGLLKDAFNTYCQLWKTKFFKLHRNEELINSLILNEYNLNDEDSPEIKFGDINLLENEIDFKSISEYRSQINRNPENALVSNYQELELPFKEKAIINKLVSYSVGCMFGRYSLDKEGLILANKGETLEDYLKKVEKSKSEVSFLPDDDNIIPVLDEDWFEDDIVGRFRAFLKASFGSANFEKNLAFVEEHITHGDIRKYFNKSFNRDHYKRYNKRPIYWMFSSPNGVFKALIYMHRYTPDTLNRMLNDYLREYKSKLTYRKDHLQEIINSSSDASEVNQAEKEQRKLSAMLRELQEYERNVLMPLATERISIDLDDGVLVNYNKFGKAVEEIKSVNDPKKKKKVAAFDWVDGDEIR